MPEIIAYSEDLLPAWAELHNACFNTQHNFWRPGPRVLKQRIVGAPGFDPANLLFARHEGELVGFAHGGPGHLLAVGVHPAARRSGIARDLVAALAQRLGPLRPDCRGMSPFWGNARGPETSFFGMVEGIGAQVDDSAAQGFLAAQGFTRGPEAMNLRVTPDSLDLEPGRDARKRAETLGLELGLMRGRCPVIGQDANAQRPLAGRGWFSAVAMHAARVAGFAVAFPTPELGPGRYGIFALEVDREHRRKGVGSALVMQLLLEMQGGPFTACEVTTVPLESPGAMELYERLGFQPCARFAIWS